MTSIMPVIVLIIHLHFSWGFDLQYSYYRNSLYGPAWSKVSCLKHFGPWIAPPPPKHFFSELTAIWLPLQDFSQHETAFIFFV